MKTNSEDGTGQRRVMHKLGFAYALGALAGLTMIGCLVYINTGQEFEAPQYVVFALAAVAFVFSLILQIRASRDMKKNRP